MYENERLCESRGMEKVCTPAPNGSMTDLLRETNCIASDALAMSSKINGHLFGYVNATCEEKERHRDAFTMSWKNREAHCRWWLKH